MPYKKPNQRSQLDTNSLVSTKRKRRKRIRGKRLRNKKPYHEQIPYHTLIPTESHSARWPGEAGIYRELAHDIGESEETHIIPRESLSSKQDLLHNRQYDIAEFPWRQLNKTTGEMILGSDYRTIWRSDKTLLLRGKPFEHIGPSVTKTEHGFKREGSIRQGQNVRKTITTVVEPNANEPILIETILYKGKDNA